MPTSANKLNLMSFRSPRQAFIKSDITSIILWQPTKKMAIRVNRWSIVLATLASIGNASFLVHPVRRPTPLPGRTCETFTVSIVCKQSPSSLSDFHAANNNYQIYNGDDSIDKYSNDVAKVLKELRPEELDEAIPAIFRSKKLSFTRLWDLEDWEKHTSRWRYARYLTGLSKSRLLRRVLPQLAVLTLWSMFAVWLRMRNYVMEIPLTTISLVSSFVAALLTLRSNQGLSRLSDGRAALGKAILYTRDTAQIVASSVYHKDPQLAMIMIRHLSLFIWVLKSHLREKMDDDIVRVMLPNTDDANYVLHHRKSPLAVLSKLRQCITSLVDRNLLPMAEHLELEHHVTDLNYVVMATERIRAAPIPPLYTSHTGRLLVFNLLLLPMALTTTTAPATRMLDVMGKFVSTVLTTVLVGFAMFGLDEISHDLEQPFRLMPLYQISKLAMMDVSDTLVCPPPPLILSNAPTAATTTIVSPPNGGESNSNKNMASTSSDAKLVLPNRPAYW